MLLPSPLVDFGPVGVASIPLITALAARNLSAGAWASGPVVLPGNVGIVTPFVKLADVSALLASPVAALSLHVALRVLRLPTYFFYAYLCLLSGASARAASHRDQALTIGGRLRPKP